MDDVDLSAFGHSGMFGTDPQKIAVSRREYHRWVESRKKQGASSKYAPQVLQPS